MVDKIPVGFAKDENKHYVELIMKRLPFLKIQSHFVDVCASKTLHKILKYFQQLGTFRHHLDTSYRFYNSKLQTGRE